MAFTPNYSCLGKDKTLRFSETVDELILSDTGVTNNDTDLPSQQSPEIPDVNERLAYLRPSRELLEFYRKRFAQQDGEHESLVDQLSSYKTVCDGQFDEEWSMRQREEEICELQKALSDIQLSLFQEREQVLRLYAENDRYKIRDLASRRSIKKLLEDSGQPLDIDDEIPDELPMAKSLRESRFQSHIRRVPKSEGYKLVIDAPAPGQDDRQTRKGLQKQIEGLQAKLEAQTRDFKQIIDRKVEDRVALASQYDYIREKDTDKIKTVTEKLHKTQELLYMSTEDALTFHQQSKAQERQWMIQKDKLLRELDCVKEQLTVNQPESTRKVVLNVSQQAGESTRRQKQEIERLKEEVLNAHNLQEMYREQVISLEDDLARLREQDDLKNDDFNEKVDKMGKRYHLLKTRFEELEKKRNLEVEGFKHDIKTLRKRLKGLEHQLFKVTVGGLDSYLDETKPEDVDLAVLKNIRTTAKRSNHINDSIKDMKLRIHKMANW